MNTAQVVLTQNAKTQRETSIAPWVIGGVVVIVALFVISQIKR